MKIKSILATLTFIANLVFLQAEPVYNENYLIAQFDNGMTRSEIQVFIDDTNVSLDKLLVRRLNIWRLRVNISRSTTETTKAEMETLPIVTYVQYDHYVTQRSIPNDTQFPNQWALHNTGQSGGTTDADIDTPDAWDYSTGGTNGLGDEIVVAVIDGGCMLNHTDLNDNIWTNVNEGDGDSNNDNCPGDCNVDDDGDGLIDEDSQDCGSNGYDINGTPCTYLNDMDSDDDENGYIDDINGWDAYNSDGSIPNNDHGTHVSGIIGAEGNNNSMVSGVNWNTKIMVIAGSGNQTSIVLEAYGYVLDQRIAYNESGGARGTYIIATNSSFGINNADCESGSYPLWNDMYDEMGEAGILSVAATMNNNSNVDVTGDVPTGCDSDYLITVTNTTRFDTKNSGAAYGATTIDLGAPGTDIISTWGDGGTEIISGTSMATPHVAGSVALIHASVSSEIASLINSDYGQGALTIKNAILENVDPITGLSGNTVSGGRLNVHKAIQYFDYNVMLANRHNNNPTSNLGGTLSLYNLDTPDMDFENVISDSDPVPVFLNDSYTVRTNNYALQGERHLKWQNNVEDHLLVKSDFVITIDHINNSLNGNFDFQNEVTITSDHPVQLKLHDPWYLENPDVAPTEWIQPDEFRPLNEQLNSSGNINVFLNQNPNFLPDLPIYRIKASGIGETTQNDIFVFSHWAAHEDIDYGNGINTISNDLETDVVFKDVNAEVIAVYSPASELPNYTLIIEQGETLTILSGSEITFAEGFKIIVEGELDFQATAEAPITLEGVADEKWAGIEVMPSSYWNPSHIIFKDAETAIKMDNVEPASIFNCQFENCGIGLELSKSIFTISNNSFRHSSGIRVFSSNGITIADINNNDFNNCSIGVMADGSATIRVNRNVFSQDSYGMASIITSINPYSTNRIINNTIVGNPNQTMGMALYSPDVEVKNNIIINCERGITSTFLPTNCEDNPFVLSDGFNNIWGNELNYCNIYPSETDVSVDPLLNSNHQLTENSPCIDAGDPDSPLDPDGTRLDIGAFYFDKVPNAPTGFTILGDVGDHPELTWDEHEESDVNEFLIYRSLNYGAFLLTATVSQTNWVDTEVTINNEKKFSNRACYYIKAVDAIMQESPSTTPQCESVDIGLKKQAFTLIPKVYEWSSAHPNPFNPTTTIQYGLPVSSHITFTIHNMVGQLIRTLQLREIPAGVHSIQWNSLNDAGEKVPSGMYIVQMKAISTNAKKHFTNAQKVVLLK